MSRSHLLTLLVLSLYSLAGNPAGAWQTAPVQLAPQEGMVLLRNGQFLKGRVSRSGDRWVVWLPDGEIRLRADEVELVCRDVADAYRQKRERIKPGQLRDRLQLVQWCLQYELLEEAGQELAAARAIDDTHPVIPVLERRLQLALNPPPSHERETDPATGPLGQAAMVSNAQLDRLVRQMPAGTVEEFTQHIQPLLVNTCAAGSCHGPASKSDLMLLRIPADRPATRRVTQRNLHAVLGQINHAQPSQSPLLTRPTAPHGPLKTPIYVDPASPQLQQLAAWVTSVAAAAEPSKLSPSMTAGAQPAATGGPNGSSGEQSPVVRTAFSEGPPRGRLLPTAPKPLPEGEQDEAPLTDELPQLSEPPRVPQPKLRFEPADPFDPELFNREYSPRKGNR